MKELPETKRGYQAEVHFALATVVQGITIAALGNEFVLVLKDLQFPMTIWIFITGIQSLLICVTFWYAFVMAYFSGFRTSILTASNHFVLASTYFVIGLLQLIAIQFLADPRLWLTLVLMLLAAALFSAWYAYRHIEIAGRDNTSQSMDIDPISRVLIVVFLAALACLILWYLIPGIDSGLFRAISLSVIGAGLILLDIVAIRDFQEHLEKE